MAKLDWSKKPNLRDPGSLIDAPEDFRIDPWISPTEREKRRAKVEAATRRLLARSERRRFAAMIKKYGVARATAMGVPASFVVEFARSEGNQEAKSNARTASKRRAR